MEVKLIKENEDGSSDFSLDMSQEEKESLIRFAIITALKNAINEGNLYVAGQFGMDNPGSTEASSLHGESKYPS